MTLRLLDTFSGIGGFSYAAEYLVGGFETVAFVEREPFCQQILHQHWPNVTIHDDIRTFKAERGSADVITAGFPCQDISTAGFRKGITEQSRSGMFFEVIRIVDQIQPKFVVLENVSAITENGLGIVLSLLAEAGYDAEWACIPASAVGACHRRDRWWLVAYTMRKLCKGGGAQGEPKSGVEFQNASITWRYEGSTLSSDWHSYLSEPVLCRGDDGLSNRVDRIKALGNSIVPHVATIPLQRVLDLSTPQDGDTGPQRLQDMLSFALDKD